MPSPRFMRQGVNMRTWPQAANVGAGFAALEDMDVEAGIERGQRRFEPDRAGADDREACCGRAWSCPPRYQNSAAIGRVIGGATRAVQASDRRAAARPASRVRREPVEAQVGATLGARSSGAPRARQTDRPPPARA